MSNNTNEDKCQPPAEPRAHILQKSRNGKGMGEGDEGGGGGVRLSMCVCMYGGVSDTGRRMIEIPNTFHEMKDKKR